LPNTSWLKAVSGALRAQILPGLRAAASPRLYAVLGLGFGAWLLPAPGVTPSVSFLILSGLAEEVVFRLLVQGELSRLTRRAYDLPGISRANIATSGLFAAMHLVHHPPLWAVSVFFPSLIFGWAMDRYGSVLPPVVIHVCYNILYFYRP
jgi:hypothetical protein